MNHKGIAKKFVQVASAFVLALGLMLATVLAADRYAYSLESNPRSPEEIEASVSSMLAAGNYAEGEAIVCCVNTSSRLLGAVPSGASGDLLASSEMLSSVSVDQFAEALDGVAAEAASEPEAAAAETAQRMLGVKKASDTVRILLVHRDGMSTEELLKELLQDSRVLSAEPNYIMGFAEETEDDPADTPAETDDPDTPAADDPDTPVEPDDPDTPVDPDDPDTPVDPDDPDTPVDPDDPDTPVDPDDPDTPVDPDDPDTPVDPDDPDTPVDPDDPDTPVDPDDPDTPSDDPQVEVSYDLTPYQWFSVGSQNVTPQLTNGTNPGINSPKWNTPGATNSEGVVVIMDSGVDYTHPDLANVMYHFSDELQTELGCGEYGYAPDREDVTDPMDGYGHGTHCAGIVAAEWNDFGVSGIASGAKIVAVSVSQSTENSDFSYAGIIKGYDFIIRAVEAGVDIRSVNRSLECAPTNTANNAMCIAAGELGVVTCIASGNTRQNLDVDNTDPGMYQTNPYILRVNAAGQQDSYAWFTSFGTYTTDVFAPGVNILSTVPSNRESFSRYFPQADDDPLYLGTAFDDDLLDVHGSDLDDPESKMVTVSDVYKGNVGIDGDGESIAADVTVFGEHSHVIYIDVAIDSLDLNDVQDMSVAVFSPDLELHNLSLGILLEDGTYSFDYARPGVLESTSTGAPRDWAIASFHLYDPDALGQDVQFVTDSQDRTCIRLAISGSFEKEGGNFGNEVNSTIYIDQIAIGKRGNTGLLPYQYMNGTSMATPVVTAAAAVVSSAITGTSPAERAATTVNRLKGTVHQTDGYKGYCKQNGQIDLSFLTSAASAVPVLTNVTTYDNLLVLSGTGFGTTGTLTVEGIKATVISWADTAIVANWPAGVTSGLLRLSVTSGTGAAAQRAFIVEAPASAASGTQTYERDLEAISVTPGSPSTTAVPMSMTATDDGTLFAAAADTENRLNITLRYIMRSDDRGETWSAIQLPQDLKDCTITAGDGTLYVFGATPAEDAVLVETWYLYSYDIEKDTFELLRSYEHFGEEVENRAEIVYAGGFLYYVDSYADPDDYEAPSHMRVKRFADDYSLLDTYTFTLDHDYQPMGFFDAPKVSGAGDSFYVGYFEKASTGESVGMCTGLERVDVAADGTLTCTDLSKSIAGLDIKDTYVCIAASNQGVFLIGQGLDTLAGEGTPRTDTYFLKKGAAEFEPFDKTLSYSPVFNPAAVCANGWLYAYANSMFEPESVFGRATKLPVAITGWQKEGDTWYYYKDDGTKLTEDWVQWQGAWYFFGKDGALVQEGWATYGYYIRNYSPLKEGWVVYGDGYGYIRNYQLVQEGWASYAGKWYYIKNYVPMANGWATYAGKWYFYRNYNLLVNSWINYDGTLYHFNSSGVCDRAI